MFSKSADYGFKGAGSGFLQLVRETLSENAMLPELTYFYCNSVSQEVSQEEREALGCGARKEDRTVSAVRQAPFGYRSPEAKRASRLVSVNTDGLQNTVHGSGQARGGARPHNRPLFSTVKQIKGQLLIIC